MAADTKAQRCSFWTWSPTPTLLSLAPAGMMTSTDSIHRHWQQRLNYPNDLEFYAAYGAENVFTTKRFSAEVEETPAEHLAMIPLPKERAVRLPDDNEGRARWTSRHVVFHSWMWGRFPTLHRAMDGQLRPLLNHGKKRLPTYIFGLSQHELCNPPPGRPNMVMEEDTRETFNSGALNWHFTDEQPDELLEEWTPAEKLPVPRQLWPNGMEMYYIDWPDDLKITPLAFPSRPRSAEATDLTSDEEDDAGVAPPSQRQAAHASKSSFSSASGTSNSKGSTLR